MDVLPEWLERTLPIVGLLVVIALVVRRLPKVELGHSRAYIHRRAANWLLLGLTYAFLYMGRYNINAAKNAGIMDKPELGKITAIGAFVYGLSFIVNGTLADRFGGRKTILVAAVGSALANAAMGALVHVGHLQNITLTFGLLYGANMYFQSFGAVSIVKVNSAWFHVRERGVFGGVFGILISLGIYFAYDWGSLIIEHASTEWVFFVPAILLGAFFVVDAFVVFDRPSDTGHRDFDTGDATSGQAGPPDPVGQVALKMIRNPVIVTIALIELCSGFIRGAVMKWTYVFLPETGAGESFVYENWGLLLCCAGILGAMFAGTISDRVFQSRRGPSATILYAMIAIGAGLSAAMLSTPAVGFLLVFVVMAVIGVHGMLAGTASMDFGGTRNAGVAVGLIDGMVYLGYGTQAWLLGDFILPTGEASADPANWIMWPLCVLGIGIIGFLLALRIWYAKPEPAEPPGRDRRDGAD